MTEHPPLSRQIPELAGKYAKERKDDPLLPADLQYAGHGGESVVFRVGPKEGREGTHRRLVLKADMHYLKRGLLRDAYTRWETRPRTTSNDERIQEGAKAMHEQEDDSIGMEDVLDREADFMKALLRSFPSDQILPTRTVISEVPVTPEVACEILGREDLKDLASSSTVRVPTIVRYQEMIPERARMLKKEGGENHDMHSFGFRYVERFDIPLNEYQRLNRMTFGEREPFDARLFYGFLHVGTVRLLEDSYKDQDLANRLRDMVQHMITFTKTSDKMLDLAGGGNVRVYKNNEGKWTYLIVDPFADIEWTGVRDVAQRLLGSTRVDTLAGSDFLNAINYARALNGMARILGLEDRLTFLSGVDVHLDKQSEKHLFFLRSRHHWPDKKVFGKAQGTLEATVPRKK
ncbi:hypothetical protein HZA87_01355 [Candidatus Uhrbacteria bacterium]|nr:hypothetical protein [Candidatus Uhrbacteria bacterium]